MAKKPDVPAHNCPDCDGGWQMVERLFIVKGFGKEEYGETREVRQECKSCGGMGVIGG